MITSQNLNARQASSAPAKCPSPTVSTRAPTNSVATSAKKFDQVRQKERFHLVHCLVHPEAPDALHGANIKATRGQIDGRVHNSTLYYHWKLHKLVHSPFVDPKLEAELLDSSYPKKDLPNPGYLDKEINVESLKIHCKDIENIRSAAVRELPSGTNDADSRSLQRQREQNFAGRILPHPPDDYIQSQRIE